MKDHTFGTLFGGRIIWKAHFYGVVAVFNLLEEGVLVMDILLQIIDSSTLAISREACSMALFFPLHKQDSLSKGFRILEY